MSGATISTDEWRSYRQLARRGYRHLVVKHSAEEWVRGVAHTNTVDGFWSQLKRSIRGTHVHVSRKHLPKYLGEFKFRYNMRKMPDMMFVKLIMNF